MSRVVALYTDPRGPYPALLGADSCWDQARDARLYEGPDPVVAHPPCGPWGRLKHLYQGTEHDCAPRALSQVSAYGGVLEHPANSDLWACAGLPKPGEEKRFVRGSGFTIQVDQCDWGHVARKSTWLYIVGLSGRETDKLFRYAAWRRGTGTHPLGQRVQIYESLRYRSGQPGAARNQDLLGAAAPSHAT